MYRAIIFDVDGTLIDGTEGIISSVKYIIHKFGLPELDEAVLKSFIGPPIQDSLKHIYNLDEKEVQVLADEFRNKYKTEDVYKAEVYEDVFELMSLLKESGYKIGVATFKREDYAISLLENLGLAEFCDEICGADNDNVLKKADIIRNCLDKLGLNSKECLMIGDSPIDAVGAEINGMDFIGLTYGFGFKTKEELNKFKHILSVESVQEIINYFVNMGKSYLSEIKEEV